MCTCTGVVPCNMRAVVEKLSGCFLQEQDRTDGLGLGWRGGRRGCCMGLATSRTVFGSVFSDAFNEAAPISMSTARCSEVCPPAFVWRVS